MSDDERYPMLGELLIETGAITKKTLSAALKEQKTSKVRLGEILIKNGWITERQLAEALSRQLKLPFVSFARCRPTPEAIRVIPESVAQRLDVVPLAILASGKVSLAMADPLNLIALDELRMITNAEFEISVAAASDVRRALLGFYKVQTSLDDAITEAVAPGAAGEADGVPADDAPVVRLVNNILEQAVKEGASDVHVEIFERAAKVRFRVDGSLFESCEYPADLHPAVVSHLKIIANMDISERRKPQDGRIMIEIGGRRIDLRASVLPSLYGEKAVMRLLDRGQSRVGLSGLGLFEDDVALLRKIVTAPHGVILLTGPTGSGKSTTLYSLLEIINTPDVNIITVEDPVEYTMPGITQVQVNERAGFTFSEALRSILRQDPDKCMVGEIRDYPTAELAIRAALTGHLVLSTLHTNDAPSSIARLTDMGIPPYLLASSIAGLVAQRLLRRLCRACRRPYQLDAATARAIGAAPGETVYAPVGCEECRGTGYRGRAAVAEIMQVDEDLRRLIGANAPVAEIRAAARGKGMRLLTESALRLVRDGTSSVPELLALMIQA